ncbi:MAG: hypothetical protein KDD66_05790 [Bdellovibrionales bacterium]|nr:hypothetical protein [Bdellovibrionales bacterium]
MTKFVMNKRKFVALLLGLLVAFLLGLALTYNFHGNSGYKFKTAIPFEEGSGK